MHTLLSSTLILLLTLFIPQKKIMIVGNKIVQIDSTETVHNLSLKYESGFITEKFQIKRKD